MKEVKIIVFHNLSQTAEGSDERVMFVVPNPEEDDEVRAQEELEGEGKWSLVFCHEFDCTSLRILS